MALKVLYMTRQPIETLEEGLLPDFAQKENRENTSLLLLEEGVTSRIVPDVQMYALRDDVLKRGGTAEVPLLTYSDVVKLVFEMDRVVVL